MAYVNILPMGNDVESKAMSVTTMAVVNPYTKNVDASKRCSKSYFL